MRPTSTASRECEPVRYLSVALILALLGVTGYQILLNSRSQGLPEAIAVRRVGDVLPDVSLRRSNLDGSSGTTVPRHLRNAVGSRCAVVLFFSPTCLACETIAPLWSDRRSVLVGATRLTVMWVSVTPDVEEGRAFMTKHRLHGPLYVLPRISDMFALGVHGTPTLYVVGSDLRLLGMSDGNPETLPVGIRSNHCRTA